MAQKRPFFGRDDAVAVGTLDELKTERVDTGVLQVIQRVGVENATTAYTKLRLIKAGTGGEFPLEEEDTPQAGKLYWTDTPIYLVEGQYLIARLTGCTASDVLAMYYSGYEVETKEGGYA